MNVRLGINPLTWTIDDLPEVGGDTPLETCLGEAHAAGFEGVELGCKFPRTAPELRAALAPHGLALVSGWYSARLLERDAAAEFVATGAGACRCVRPCRRPPGRSLQPDSMNSARACRMRDSGSPIIITWARSCRSRTKWTG